MSQPQSGILPESNQHAIFITLRMTADSSEVIGAIASVPGLTERFAKEHGAANLSSVVGIGSDAWDKLFPAQRPRQLRPFRARQDGARSAPSTAGDFLLHIRSERQDVNFILARKIMAQFGSAVTVIEEIAGYRYFDSRDMTGFIDGTENPQGEHRAEVGLVIDEIDFIGGSYISLQRYVHNLDARDKLPVATQEGHIGRTKADDVQLKGDDKPATAHISRAVVEEDGMELEILRHSMPYGGVQEAGLLFIAYAGRADHFDKMLGQMVIADSDGHYDHLLDFTQAVTGNQFFAPSLDFLSSL